MRFSQQNLAKSQEAVKQRLLFIKQMVRTESQLRHIVLELMNEVSELGAAAVPQLTQTRISVQPSAVQENVVAIIGSSGNVGLATIEALCRDYPLLQVRAGVRDVKSPKLAAMTHGNLTLTQASMSDPGKHDAARMLE